MPITTIAPEKTVDVSFGALAYDIIRSLDPEVNKNSEHVRQRAAGRMIEELVELALAIGIRPEKILVHVTDALHNEARKAKCFPSELEHDPFTREELIGELADAVIQIDYQRFLHDIHDYEIMRAALNKITRMHIAAKSGEAVIIDSLFYRKESRG